jgi:hypothetical protein
MSKWNETCDYAIFDFRQMHLSHIACRIIAYRFSDNRQQATDN